MARRRSLLVLLAAVVTLSLLQPWHPPPAVAEPVLVTPATPNVVAVVAADQHNCLLKPDGEVGCWGGQGAEALPPGAGPFLSISGAGLGTCGLRQDRSILCWGLSGNAHSVPGEFASVSAGSDTFGCGLEVDEDVSCWTLGTGSPALTHHDGPFTSVAAGAGHACAIRADTSIACWGADDAGQAPAVVAGSFRSVSAGPASTCGVSSDGSLSCWGDNSQGQAPASVAGSFTMVSITGSRGCGLRASGGAACWGASVGDGSAPEEVAGPFRTVTAGPSHACAIRTDDLLSCWGDPDRMPSPPGDLLPDPFAQGTETSPYRHGFTVSSSSPVTATVQGTLPPGITLTTGRWGGFEAELVLSGTARTRGTYTFTLRAANLFGASRPLSVTVRVLPPPGFDANGDRIPDLPVGAAGEDIGRTLDAGQIIVLLGAADGSYGRGGAVAITQETVGQRSETGDRFGAAIATGEITGDGYVDLVIGAPGEDKGAGQVVVVHGSARGLTGTKRTVLRQGLAGTVGAAEAGDGFGSAISIGNGLWIGSPGEDLGRATDAGVVTRLLTAPLRTAGSLEHQQGRQQVPGAAEKGDRFGASLAGGGALVGAPGEDIGRTADAGAVIWQLRYALTQDSAGVPGAVEAGDQFGAAVAASGRRWDTNVDGEWEWFHDIALGAPGEDIGSVKDAGVIIWGSSDIFYGDDDELEGVEDVLQNGWAPAQVESGDRFGAALTISTDGNRIVVGAPGEDVSTSKDAGAVSVHAWCDSCPNGSIAATLDQNSSGVPGSVRAGSQFGATLAERPGTSGGYVVGVPGGTVASHPAAGAVIVMPARGGAQELHQDSPDVPGSAENGDRFATVPKP